MHAENVSPECANDLFQAHASIYLFAGRFVRSARVLDLGCGTGYGSALLLAAGAREVVGLDLDPGNVRYARSRYAAGNLHFEVGNAERLTDSLGTFSVVVSSNVLEHLDDVDAALAGIRQRLAREGMFVMVVPPIVDQASLTANLRNRYHRSNLFIWEWREKLARGFASVRAFRHLPPAGVTLDFSNPFPSSVSPEVFEFLEVQPEDLGRELTLGAVFVCEHPV